MSLPVLPNQFNFLGVALVINRSRDGPRFVFHYPPHVSPGNGKPGARAGDEEVDGDDIFVERTAETSSFEATGESLPGPADLRWDQDDHLVMESGTQIVPWEYVAGLPTKDLEGILTPARAYHKRLFQVSIGPLHYVSYPIYVPKSGKWKRKRKMKQNKPAEDDPIKSEEDTMDYAEASNGPRNGCQSPAVDSDRIDKKDMAKVADKGTAADETEDKDKVSSMTMFNLVFILDPKHDEVKELVDTMYVHIIRKVNKAYKYCQQHSDFVWKESKRILALKEKGREDRRKMSSLWNEILATSSLAASMQDVYDAISQNKIAALQLDTAGGTVTHSVQIPMPFHVADLPQEDEERARGLWLTTANSFTGEDGMEEPEFLDKNFALLLMEDEKKILAELQTDPDETTLSMVEFVKHCKPTMSFYQVGQQSTNILTPSQVRKYAQHFIFWRRAIAIPPLHARDVYILSPNADLSRLPRAAADWSRQFPFAPPLSNLLAELSAAPRPYKWFCPSKAHRPAYLVMLAWLMRGAWVTQLCTFAYVIVWPEIIYEVEYALEAEELAKAKKAQLASLDELESSSGSPPDARGLVGEAPQASAAGSAALTALTTRSGSQHPGDGTTTVSEDDDVSTTMSMSQVLSPTSTRDGGSSSVVLASPTADQHDDNDEDDDGDEDEDDDNHRRHSTSSHHQPTPAEQAAETARLERIADRAARELAQKATAHARRVPPRQMVHPSVNDASHLAHLSPHIILDARKATGKESLYLSAIQRRLRERNSGGANNNSGHGPGKQPSGPLRTGTALVTTLFGPSGPGSGPSAANSTGGGNSNKGGATVPPRGSLPWDERVSAAWPVFWKYFNGKSALERVALQEDLKRKDAWNLLTAMSEYLLCVRHW